MAHLIETMAYAGETPWHGLGVKVADCLSPEDMLKAAGLDWEIEKRKVYLEGNVAIPESLGGALVRSTDSKVLGFAGPDYVPSQNRDVFKFFDHFVKAGHMKMHTAGAIKGGQEVWGLASIEKTFALAGGDEVNGFLLISNPHVWGKSLNIKFTPIRVVCNNTLTLALRENPRAGFRMPHVCAFDAEVIKAAEEALGISEHMMASFKEGAEFLASKRATDENIRRYMLELFKPEILKQQAANDGFDVNRFDFDSKEAGNKLRLVYGAVEQSPGAQLESAKGTWWGAFNAVTFVVDHKVGRTRDTALQSAWFGQGASIKAKSFERAIAYARAA